MKGRYLGHLSHDDVLYGYVRGHIAPQLGVNSSDEAGRRGQSHLASIAMIIKAILFDINGTLIDINVAKLLLPRDRD